MYSAPGPLLGAGATRVNKQSLGSQGTYILVEHTANVTEDEMVGWRH